MIERRGSERTPRARPHTGRAPRGSPPVPRAARARPRRPGGARAFAQRVAYCTLIQYIGCPGSHVQRFIFILQILRVRRRAPIHTFPLFATIFNFFLHFLLHLPLPFFFFFFFVFVAGGEGAGGGGGDSSVGVSGSSSDSSMGSASVGARQMGVAPFLPLFLPPLLK